MRLPISDYNTNLYHILHRFRDIAFEMSKIAIFDYPLGFNPPPNEWVPL